MSKHFLSIAHLGNNHGWRYVVGIFAILIYWLRLAGPMVMGIDAIFNQIFGISNLGFVVASLAAFPPIIGILFLVITKLHKRSFQTLVSCESAFDWRRFFLGFIVWFLQSSIWIGSGIWLNPNSYSFSFYPAQWFLLLPLALILVPIQTTAEELFFRGYLMQGLRLITKHRWVLIIITSIAFAVPHFGNPEMQRGFIWSALVYFIWGVFFAVITFKDNGLELALGCHAANNLFSTLVVNAPDSAIPTTAIWTYWGVVDARADFIYLLIDAAIFYFIFFGGIPRRRHLQR